ncbi:MAG: kelch repeat-containing protein [Ignavibacteriota bacterium]
MKKKILFFTAFVLLIFSGAQAQSGNWLPRSTNGFTARHGLTSSVVNGKIYAIGGVLSNVVEVYDPTADSWLSPNFQGDFAFHYGHAASVIDDKIYIIGGVENNIQFADSIWVLNTTTNKWNIEILEGDSRQFTDRYELTTAVLGGKIYAIGGFLAPGELTNAVEVYDTSTHSWSVPTVTKDSFQLVVTPVALVINNKIYVVGHPIDTSCHCDVQIYDPSVNKWSAPPQGKMNVPRGYFSANAIDNKIYVIGGQDWYHGGMVITTTEVFDISTGKWDTIITTGSFTARDGLTSSVIGNQIFTMGGEIVTTSVNTNEVLNLNQNSVESGTIYFRDRAYPNPATNSINVVAVEGSTQYRIVDILGRTMLTGKTVDHGIVNIDISSLPRGMYYVLVEREDIRGVFAKAGKIWAINP